MSKCVNIKEMQDWAQVQTDEAAERLQRFIHVNILQVGTGRQQAGGQVSG